MEAVAVAFTPAGVVEVSVRAPGHGVAKARRRLDGVWVMVVSGREYPLEGFIEPQDLAEFVAGLESLAARWSPEPDPAVVPVRRHLAIVSGGVR